MNEPIIITDNKEAMKILADEGLLDKMQPIAGHNATHIFFERNNHWVMALYSRGHATEGDNGFLIAMIPKSIGKQQASEIFMEAVLGTTEGDLTYGEITTNPTNQ